MADQIQSILNQTIETSGDFSFTPLEVVCLRDSDNAMNLLNVLLESGADPNSAGSYPLMIAAQAFKNADQTNSAMITTQLDAGANPFRTMPGRFRLSAFQFMLGLDLPADIIETCLEKLKSNKLQPETDITYARN